MSGGDWPFSLLESTFGNGFLINNLIMCMAMTNIVGACIMIGVVGTVMCMVFMIAAADAALDGNDALEQYYGLLAVLSLARAFFSFDQAMKEAGITADQLAVAKENAATNTNVDVDHTSVPPTSGGSGGTAGSSGGTASSASKWSSGTGTARNLYGKKGSPMHRDTISSIQASKGGEMQYEHMFSTPNGSKSRRFADAVEVVNGEITSIHQVGRVNLNGAPVIREIRAMSDIMSSPDYIASGAPPIYFWPYNSKLGPIIFGFGY